MLIYLHFTSEKSETQKLRQLAQAVWSMGEASILDPAAWLWSWPLLTTTQTALLFLKGSHFLPAF